MSSCIVTFTVNDGFSIHLVGKVLFNLSERDQRSFQLQGAALGSLCQELCSQRSSFEYRRRRQTQLQTRQLTEKVSCVSISTFIRTSGLSEKSFICGIKHIMFSTKKGQLSTLLSYYFNNHTKV